MALKVNYHELERHIFQYLQSRQNISPNFGFSMRVKAWKGSETDYFIGTAKSNYFGFTLWNVPVSFPGSSNDLFDFFIQRKNGDWKLSFQGNQIINAKGEQNKLALRLAQDSWKVLNNELDTSSYNLFQHREENKYFRYQIEPKENLYHTLEDLTASLGQMIDDISPHIDKLVTQAKQAYPELKASILNREDYTKMLGRLEKRFKKYGNNKKTSESAALENTETTPMPPKANYPLNQILYGPPGTGKTYHTVNRALEILGIDLSQPRTELKRLFDEKVEDGQIVFTTFHQSMSYEDFVEGIKPNLGDDSNTMQYDIQDGILKQISGKALKPIIPENDFEKAYSSLLKDIKDNGNKLILETLVHSKEFTIYENTKGNLKFHANTEKAYEGVIRRDHLKHYMETGQAVDWASYTKAVGQYLISKHQYAKNSASTNTQPYILIIDEINRGNVSQIFGELITLIEEDKRLGREEALEVTLPYSKEKFGVPDNLYIIGTMNTADRSVEALDVALRRRFSFEEMPPRPELLDNEINGINLQELLSTINNRIAYLLDKDHQIGHSYFIKVTSEEALREVFKRSIIPLLKEYFYNDYGKIRLVLGDDFVQEKDEDHRPKFAVDGGDLIPLRHTYELVPIDDNFPIIEALERTIHGKG